MNAQTMRKAFYVLDAKSGDFERIFFKQSEPMVGAMSAKRQQLQ